ncbi:MAG: hypothetical protein JWQ09_2432 [Segetibacter sp.]|nr:hypothetical protein [Segetibacter sp.]
MQYFETRFLEEAEKFIAGLDAKAIKKVFYNIDLAEQQMFQNFLKSCKRKFGNSEFAMQDNK